MSILGGHLCVRLGNVTHVLAVYARSSPGAASRGGRGWPRCLFAQRGDAAGRGKFGEGVSAGFGNAGEVLVTVYGDEAEFGEVAFGPLEVVERRPVEIAA